MNPWLAEKVIEYRERHSDKALREEFQAANEANAEAGIRRSWEECLAVIALRDALLEDPFLLTSRTDMDLPQETIDGLYWCRVDTVADLLQITEEELRTLGRDIALDIVSIEGYLAMHGLNLYRSPQLTIKIPVLDALEKRGKAKWSSWTLDTPGLADTFDIYRPTVQDKWFEQYYERYEHLEGSEKLLTEYLPIKPECPDGELPADYLEFFRSIRNLWDYYVTICGHCLIQPKYDRPGNLPERVKDLDSFSNERFLNLRKEAARVMVDLFERTSLFKHGSAGQYLQAEDTGKLNIAEEENAYEPFQVLMIVYVEVCINLENVLIFLDEYKTFRTKRCLTEKPAPVEPRLAEAILKYRQSQDRKSVV